MLKALCMAAGLTLAYFPLAGIADSPTANLVRIGNGANSVDFTGDGIADLVVMGHRENFNAHSFDVVSFYILVVPKDGSEKEWDIVPVMEAKKETLEVTVSGGADCVLHDFRLLSGSNKIPATLVLADRDIGTSYADSRIVTFTYFSLTTNKEEQPGFPRYSFEKTRTAKSKVPYCDVEEAFQKELGIGTYAR